MAKFQGYVLIQMLACVALNGVCPGTFAGTIDSIKRNDLEVVNTIRAAQTCMPKITADRIRLCTGLSFDRTTIRRLKVMDKITCQKEIEKRGYRVLTSYDSGLLSKSSWNEFVNSTKRAETLQKEKAVLLRPFATTADCIHEWVHVNQYVVNTTDRLNPVVRDKRMAVYETEFEKAVTEIEKLEKTGQKEDAQNTAKLLEPYIDHLKTFWKLHQTLDEKDAHLLTLHGCRTWWTCSDDDVETSIANLVTLKDILSPKIREEVMALARTMLQKKESLALKRITATWNTFSVKDWHLIENFFHSSINKISDQVKTKGVSIQVVEGAIELFFSKTEGGCSITVGSSDKLGIMDAAVQAIQIAGNPILCEALTLPSTTEKQFKEGQLSKTQFETRILNWRAIVLIAELERLSVFVKNCDRLPADQCADLRVKAALLTEKLEALKESQHLK